MINHAQDNTVYVLLATYNGERWIREQLDSILAQTNVALKLIVRDDGSSDSTPQILEEYAQNNSNVWLLYCESLERGATENFFSLLRNISVQQGYVALADQDDVWQEDKLSRALSQMAQSGAGGYSSNVLSIGRQGKTRLIRKDFQQTEYDYLFEGPGPGSTFVLTAAESTSLSDYLIANPELSCQVLIHDWFIYAYLRARGVRWHIDNYPGVSYRQHDSNEIGANLGFGAALKRARLILSGGGFQQAVQLRRLLFDANATDPYPYPVNRKAMLKLLVSASRFRRRARDQWFFRLAMLMLLLSPKRSL